MKAPCVEKEKRKFEKIIIGILLLDRNNYMTNTVLLQNKTYQNIYESAIFFKLGFNNLLFYPKNFAYRINAKRNGHNLKNIWY